jgi:hypothetical protein
MLHIGICSPGVRMKHGFRFSRRSHKTLAPIASPRMWPPIPTGSGAIRKLGGQFKLSGKAKPSPGPTDTARSRLLPITPLTPLIWVCRMPSVSPANRESAHHARCSRLRLGKRLSSRSAFAIAYTQTTCSTEAMPT